MEKKTFLASRLVQIETDFCVRMSVSGFLRVGVDLLAQKMESSTQRGPPYNHPQLQTTEVVGAQVAELAVCEISDEAVSSCSGTFRSERIWNNFPKPLLVIPTNDQSQTENTYS